ncbi:MAG: prepilin-type N-terminal cleavage/methylation domain-containing protein [Phycisphaerae bacterium]|nr:prepilin-type N-terminal cleavage/methylation domain-containing protein [Phycisphaerae bacterium]
MRQRHILTASARGFSLLELTMVILLIGILTAAAALSLGGFVGRGKVRVTQSSLTTIKGALEGYKLQENVLPPDLRTLVTAKYLDDKAIVDAWNRPFIYVVPGRNNRPFELQSRGENENDPSDDLSVWDINRPAGS